MLNFDPKTMRRKRGWMTMRVSDVYDETHDTKTFRLVDAEEGGRVFDYIPGQYLTLRFDELGEKPVVRSYTMSSSPCEGDYAALTVKRVEQGLVSNHMCDILTPGTLVRAMGPIGKFCYFPASDRPHLYMVAAGSGVTPFISIMREFAPHLGQEGAPAQMTLLVAYRSRQDLINWREIEEIRRYAGTKVIVTLTRDQEAGEGFWHGRPDRRMIQEAVQHDFANMTLMTCGPEALMQLAVAVAAEHGVSAEHIKTESFET